MKKIVICGATGTQGRSVLEVMRQSNQWKIVTFSRDIGSHAAMQLKSMGVSVEKADLEDLDSLMRVMRGAAAVYGMTQPWNKSYTRCDTAGELKQGQNIVTACKQTGVPHLVLTTAAHLNDEKMGLPHVDVKIDIEAFAKAGGVPMTILKPAQFMDNVGMRFLPVKRGKIRGFVDGDAKVPYVATRDLGVFAKLVLENPPDYIGKEIKLIGDFISGNALCETMGRIRGESFSYTTVPKWLIWLISREFYKMRMAFEDFSRSAYAGQVYEEIDNCRKTNPEMLSMEAYLRSAGWASVKL